MESMVFPAGLMAGCILLLHGMFSFVKRAFSTDTMILRFNFISDNMNNNSEGWMIDNIRHIQLTWVAEYMTC